MAKPLETITLYYREGSSDKVYQATLAAQGEGFVVNFAYGRRGDTLKTGTKTQKPVIRDTAKKLYDGLIREKMAKGYTPGEDGTPYQDTANEQRSTGILPQLLNPVDENIAVELLSDSAWYMQEKLDGRRILLNYVGGTITGINRKGLVIALPEPVVAYSRRVGRADTRCLLDGEAIGDHVTVFDLLELDGENLRSKPYSVRLVALYHLIQPSSKPIRALATACGTENKTAMFAALKERKAEGVVFKRHDAPYTVGRPASGGSAVKFKFCATASCIVASVNDKRSVALELFSDTGARVAIGNVTIQPGKDIPEPNQIIEVRYLYAYPGGSLYQPVFLDVRDDLVAAECSTSQLKYKAESEDEAG